VRPRQVRRRFAAAAISLTVLTGAGTFWAAEAHAGPVEEQAYLATLDHFGVPYSSASAAVAAGESVCDGLDAGLTLNQIAVIALDASGYTPRQVGYIVGASVGALCDEYLYLLDDRRVAA
jgi:hypothetical protein